MQTVTDFCLQLIIDKFGFMFMYPICILLYFWIAAADLRRTTEARSVIDKLSFNNRFRVEEDMWRLFRSPVDPRAGAYAAALLVAYKLLYFLFLFGVFSFFATLVHDLLFNPSAHVFLFG